MSIRRLSLELDLDASTFTGSMREAGRVTLLFQNSVDSTARSVKNIERSVTGAGARIRDLTVTLAAARYAIENVKVFLFSWAGALVKASAEIERTSFLLRGLSKELTDVGRAKEAADNLAYIMDLAKNAPFSINALSSAFVKLKAGGIEPTNGSLKALVNAVSAFGGSEQQLDRAAIAIQQMAGKGVVSMEELRQQLGEAVPSAMRLMAQSMGLTMSELTKKVSTGTVEAQSALGKMLAMFELTYGGASAAMMDTFNGKVSQAKTGLIEFALVATGLEKDGTTKAGGFFDTLKNAISDFTLALRAPEVRQFGVALGNGMQFATSALLSFVRGVGALNSVIPIFSLMKSAAIGLAVVMTANLANTAIRAIIAGFAGMTLAMRTSVTSMGVARAELAAYSLMIGTATGAAGKFTVATTLGGYAAVAFGRAALNLIPVVGTVIAVLWSAADAFGLFRDRAKEAKKAIEDFQRTGIATEETLKQTASQIKSLETEIVSLQNRVKMKGSTGAKGEWVPLSDKELADGKKKIAELQRQVGEVRTAQAQAQNVVTEDTGRHAGETWMKDILRRPEFKAIEEQRRKALAIDAAVQADESKNEAEKKTARQTFIDAEKDFDRQQVALFNRSIVRAEANAKLNEGNATEFAKHTALVANLKAQRDAIDKRDDAGGVYDRLSSDNKYIGGKGDKSKAATDAIQDRIAQMKAQAAGLKALIDNDGLKGSTEVAKMVSLLDSGLLKGVKNATDLKDQLIAAAETLDKLKSEQDGQKAFNGLIEERDKQVSTVEGLRAELDAILSKTEETIQANARYRAGLEDNVKAAQAYSPYAEEVRDQAARKQREGQQLSSTIKTFEDIRKETAAMQSQASEAFDEIYAGTDNLNMAMLRYQKTMEKQVQSAMPKARAQARALADEAIKAFGQVQAAKALAEMNSETRDINRELMPDQSEARRQAFEEHIAQMKESLNLDLLSVEQRKKAEQSLYEYVRALRQKALSDNPMVKMSREWANATDNMKAAGAGWMDSFVNQLAEGKLNVADFAKSVLGDILKIIVRAMIANMILSAIGLASPAGSASSGASTVNPGVGNFRPQIAHTGGIAGSSALQTKTVPMSVFSNAMKYHTGGIAGLKSNEVPTILERGEGVFTKDQMAAMGGRAQQTPSVSVNVINESGTKMEAQQGGTRFDGRNMILDVVIDAASKPGKMRDALKGASR